MNIKEKRYPLKNNWNNWNWNARQSIYCLKDRKSTRYEIKGMTPSVTPAQNKVKNVPHFSPKRPNLSFFLLFLDAKQATL